VPHPSQKKNSPDTPGRTIVPDTPSWFGPDRSRG
jgi:hypothetical protein